MSSKFIIYGLFDPRDGQLRYVGKSVIGLKRAREHAFPAHLKNDKSHCGNWIRLLIRLGIKCGVVLLHDVGDPELLSDAEIFWIAYFRKMGYPLTNFQDGGLGRAIGTKMPPEARRNSSLGAYRRWGTQPPHKDEVVSMYLSGATTRQVAERFGLSTGGTYTLIKSCGVKMRNKSEARILWATKKSHGDVPC
jgi:hypothetical protein